MAQTRDDLFSKVFKEYSLKINKNEDVTVYILELKRNKAAGSQVQRFDSFVTGTQVKTPGSPIKEVQLPTKNGLIYLLANDIGLQNAFRGTYVKCGSIHQGCIILSKENYDIWNYLRTLKDSITTENEAKEDLKKLIKLRDEKKNTSTFDQAIEEIKKTLRKQKGQLFPQKTQAQQRIQAKEKTQVPEKTQVTLFASNPKPLAVKIHYNINPENGRLKRYR